MSSLFISHSSRDNVAAKELKERLEEKGHRSVFLDLDPEKGIQAGVSWELTLYTKLRSCRAVVALCSDNYFASQWCFAEIALARMEGKELFALLIDPLSEQTQLPSILTEDQYLDLRTEPAQGYERLWNGFAAKGIVPEENRAWAPGEPPYPGLRAFDESDAPIFFGRDDEVRQGVELLTRVRRQGHPRMVMVLGSSGSGKSSLARAGIVPRLRRDGDSWLVVGPFRPGRHPVRELALALAEAFERAGKPRPWEDILERLAPNGASPGGKASAAAPVERPSSRARLRAALTAMEAELSAADSQLARSVGLLQEYLAGQAEKRQVAAPPRSAAADEPPLAAIATELRLASSTHEAKVVLLIDQFEELLGHEAEGPAHPANRLLALLRDGIESEDNPPLALGTMRSDFLGLLQRSGPLRGVGFKSLSVGPMSDEGMRRVIDQPALLGQIDLEDELTHRLLRETGTPDALPLLAFTLRAMWDRYHEDRRFDVRGYEALGGLQGAIAQVADDTLEAALGESAEGTEKDLRIAFLSLARPAAEGTGWARQPASWDELPERVRPMIQRFVDQRLLIKRADGTVEVAHEALFRSWETLRGWLNADAEGLHLRREIRVDAEKWEGAATADDKTEYLWRGGRLARALELRRHGVLRLTELDTLFIEASESEENRQIAAEEARRRAELEQARKLAEEQQQRAEERARSVRNTRRFAAAVSLALIGALAAAWVAYQKQIQASDHSRIAIASEWMSRDPTRAALVLLELRKPENAPHAVQLLSDALGQPLALAELRGHTDAVTGGDFSRSGDRIVTSSEDGTARVWNADGTPLPGPDGEPTELRHADEVYTAVFSPDGGRVLTACADNNAWLWAFHGGGEPIPLAGHKDKVTSASFDAAGNRIVTSSDDGTARVWEADGSPATGGGEPIVLAHVDENGKKEEVNAAAFSPAGDRIVTASFKGTVRVWDAESGERLLEHRAHEASILAVAFDGRPEAGDPAEPAGDRIVTAARDSTARVWRLTDSALVQEHELTGHQDEVYGAAFSPASTGVSVGWIVTASRDATARLWGSGGRPVRARREPLRLKHAGEINRVTFDAAGGRILTVSKDGTARVWRAGPPPEPRILPHPRITASGFVGADERVLTASADGKVREWTAATDDAEPARSIELRVETPNPDEGGEPTLEKYPAWILRTGFGASGDRIVTASGNPRWGRQKGDDTARVWTNDGIPATRPGGSEPIVLRHPGPVVAAALAADGDRVVTASGKAARIWRIDAAEPTLLPHEAAVLDVAFAPMGDRVVTASADKAWVWDAEGRTAPTPLAHPHGPQAKVIGVAFDPSGDRIVMTAHDGTSWVWSADGSGPPIALSPHERPVATAAFSHDGKRVVTGSYDWTARVHTADGDGEPLVLGKHDGWVVSASFNRAGTQIVTTSNLDSAQIWQLSQPALGAGIRAATAICLDPAFRESAFRENPEKATSAHERCRKCADLFSRDPTAQDADAFAAYRRCYLPAF